MPIGGVAEWANRPPLYSASPTPKEAPVGTMKEFAGLYYREGSLDPKTLSLVALAAMAAAGCTS